MAARREGRLRLRRRRKERRIENRGRGAYVVVRVLLFCIDFKAEVRGWSWRGRKGLKYHSMKVVVVMGARSFIKYAAGKPVASVIRPMILNDHSRPGFWMKPFMAKLMTVPPTPPPA